ncbi:beta-galactosidase [Aquabacterium sp. OR-4]|uniref:beta-galactosidase n=1 Tax=Aquabacterium sp. OR-4 TaxID=2978127 RepID=UPI0028C98CEA|nr:beta-galactosidase [Aquabacterium sp. OR-4]MDT7838901.1 beta-galactosidase [Aquabacterium sp. OR-4]
MRPIALLSLAAGLLACPATRAQDLPGQVVQGAAATAPAPTPAAAAGAARGPGPAAGQRFLVSAFHATSQNRLGLFTSAADGQSFTVLASEAWQPPKGLLRDPSITRLADGCWAVAYTTGWQGSHFGLARSCNLRQWQHVADVPVALPGSSAVATQVWGPEWFRDADGALSLVVSVSTGGVNAQGQPAGSFAAWRLPALQPEAGRFGAPVRLQGLERNPIDTFVVREGGRYVAFTKNESSKLIERAVAERLDGPWVYDRTGDWAGWAGGSGEQATWLEGQALVPIVDAQGRRGWRIFLDSYRDKRIYASDSFDGLASWSPRREVVGLSGSARHFTVLAEDAAVLERATAAQGRPRKISWDAHSLMIDGERQLIWAAEFHPFRLPSPGLWRDVLQKYKAMGLNAVALYFAWGYHSPAPGHYDFSGVRDLERLLRMAAEEGLYVIVRPGPYVNAELSMGGFPGWVTRQKAEARTDAPEYQAAAGEWLTQVNAIIARHQLSTGGGTVIAYQLENEQFSVQPKNARHMQFLADKARADGISVPLFHNAASRLPDWTPRNSSAPFANPGPTDLYAFDGYPGGVCDVQGRPGTPAAAPDWGLYGKNLPRVGALASPHTPGFGAEIGAGWFDYWGSNGTYGCTAQRQGVGYQRLFYGSNLINRIVIHSIYMGFGGTSWGWQAAPVVFSSYDYGAPIDEARGLRDKALGLKAIGRFVAAANAHLAQMDIGPALSVDNPAVRLYHNVNRALNSHVLFAVQQPSSATGEQSFSFTLDTVDGRYRIPQSGRLQLVGQDGKFMLAAADLQRQRLVYTSAELWAQQRLGEHDLLVLHGRSGQHSETVLRYASQPQLRVLAGEVQSHWDAARGDLRLNLRHQGLVELEVRGGGRPPLRLLIADEATIAQFWLLDLAGAAAGTPPLLLHSPALPRRAALHGELLQLSGDTQAASPLRLWAAAGARRLQWNGAELALMPHAGDGGASLVTRQALPGPAALRLPDLMRQPWQQRSDQAETRPDFDDSRWRAADAPGSAAQVYTASEKGQPVLAMSDYGFHRGDIWYRGRFTTGAGTPAGSAPLDLQLFYGAGGAGLVQVWVDGRFIGQHELDTGRAFPETTDTWRVTLKDLSPGEHVIAVMVRNMGHNWDLFADDAHKEARGLISVSLAPRAGQRFAVPVAWRLQGAPELIADLVRGPYNNGGLGGERQGWHLPMAEPVPEPAAAAAAAGWQAAAPGAALPGAGTHWLRTRFTLDLPEGHDTQLGLAFGDTTLPRSPDAEYRALIFVNGWNLGQFIAHIGPQRVFVLPPGILNPRGDNTLALAVTTDGQPGNRLEPLKLVTLQHSRGGVAAEPVPQPRQLQR